MKFSRLGVTAAIVALAAACAPAAFAVSGTGTGTGTGTGPAVFAAGLNCPPAGRIGIPCDRLAVLSTRTGAIVRWLTPRVSGIYDAPDSIQGGWVYFLRASIRGTNAIWRVPLAGGTAQLIQAGTAQWAMSQDGHAVAYVISNVYREQVITRDLVTGQRNTITIATDPQGDDNNWPPLVTDLTWSPDDAQLALQLAPTAAISSVQVLSAFTATSISNAITAPASCPIAEASPLCTETDPAYLADGALSYAIVHDGSTSLVTWLDGRRKVLHVFAGALSQQYEMNPQGQAIWIDNPVRQGGGLVFPIWGWSGGAATKITAIPIAKAPVSVAWLLSYNYIDCPLAIRCQ